MADRESALARGLRNTGASEDEIRALLNPEPGSMEAEAWRAFATGMAEANATLDRIRAGVPGPTHPGAGSA